MNKSSAAKRIWILLILAAIILAVALILIFGHKHGNVVYLLPDGSEIQPETAKNGTDVLVPDNPQMPEGLIFTGWSFSDTEPSAVSGSSAVETTGKSDAAKTVYAQAVATHVPVFDTGLALSGGYGTKGNRVTLPLQLCGEVNVCAFEAEIQYDASQLKFVEFQNEDPGIVINVIEEEGRILLNYLDSANTVGDVALVDVVFEIIGSEPSVSPLEVAVSNATRFDDNGEMEDVDISVISGVVTIV